MNQHWSFSDNRFEWVNEAFPTKNEAISAAQMQYEDNFYIGQLIGNDDELVYLVENVEAVEVAKQWN